MSLASASPRASPMDADFVPAITSPRPASLLPRPSSHSVSRNRPSSAIAATDSSEAASSSSRLHTAHAAFSLRSSQLPPNGDNNNPAPQNTFSSAPTLGGTLPRTTDGGGGGRGGMVVGGYVDLECDWFSQTVASQASPTLNESDLRTRFLNQNGGFLSLVLQPVTAPNYPSSQDTSFQNTSTTDDSNTPSTESIAESGGDFDLFASEQGSLPHSPTSQLHSESYQSTTQHSTNSLLADGQHCTESSSTSFLESMPLTTRQTAVQAAASLESGSLPSKRRRVSLTQPKLEPPTKLADDEDLFGEDQGMPPAPVVDINPSDLVTIDLTGATEVPPELKERLVDNRIKIAAFQCAICMDNVTALTVTHCGHLFCAECLHSSLHVETTKGRCPMCRAKIDMKDRQSYGTKTKGFWPLELKLMTASRKGKRKINNIS